MKAIAFATLCILTSSASLEATTPSVQNVCGLLAAITFGAFIANVGRRPTRTTRRQA